MTPQEFKDFCASNKVEIIKPHEDGVIIYFEHGDYVFIGANTDGIYYDYQGEQMLRDSRKLLEQLRLLTPAYYESLLAKYS